MAGRMLILHVTIVFEVLYYFQIILHAFTHNAFYEILYVPSPEAIINQWCDMDPI